MSADVVESRPWPARRWWTGIAIVFVVQIALIFAFEDRSPIRPRKPEPAPTVYYNAQRGQALTELEDPTLFALPHRRGFSGAAWQTLPSPDSPALNWSEPARFLAAPTANWGAAFKSLIQTNASPAPPPMILLEPQPSTPEYFSIAPPPIPSRLRVHGDLAGRRLLATPHLQSWTNTDLLTNSIVQLLVDARGYTVSAVSLRTGGATSQQQKLADLQALEMAKDIRFEPLTASASASPNNPASGLQIGTLLFEWQTILQPSTNPPPAGP